jgi:hypothetical protein
MSFNYSLLIGTPAYGGMVHVSFLTAMTDLLRAGVPHALVTIGNESLITRARNTLISAFYARPEHSHLLFIDGDVRIEPHDIIRLVQHGKDVVGAAVALKGRKPDGSRIFNIGRALGEEGPLVAVERIGTAALLFSRTAVDALIHDAIADKRVYTPNVFFSGKEGIPSVHYDVFQTGVLHEEYLSEDYWVCQKLRELGFSIWLDPAIVTHHHGTMVA